MFEEKDFVRDKNSIEYKHMKPVSFQRVIMTFVGSIKG